jgi:hypothetical protein
MTHGIRYGEGLNIIPVIEPHALAASAHRSESVDLDMAHWVSFLISMGQVSSGAGTTAAVATMTVECSCGTTGLGSTLISFDYRLSSTMTANGWGAILHGTSDGVALTAGAGGFTNKLLLIDVDPSNAAAHGAAKRWCALNVTFNTTLTTAAVVAIVEPKYPGNAIPSSS